MKTLIVNTRRRQTIKCQRKKNLIKKCYELAKLCNLRINLVVFNEEANCLQQYSSHENFKINQIQKIFQSNKHLDVRIRQKRNSRKPKKNFIESHLMHEFLNKAVKNQPKGEIGGKVKIQPNDDSQSILGSQSQGKSCY